MSAPPLVFSTLPSCSVHVLFSEYRRVWREVYSISLGFFQELRGSEDEDPILMSLISSVFHFVSLS